MQVTLDHLKQWLGSEESETLEFKEAKTQFDSDRLVRYCAALANEGGGHFVLGITDKKPRQVVGTRAFTDLNQTKSWLLQKLHLRVDVSEIAHPNGRVVVFSVPSRPIGMPISADGRYPMRSGEALTWMTPEHLQSIFDETGPDYSAEFCERAAPEELAPEAITEFRRLCVEKEQKAGKGQFAARLLDKSDIQFLEDVELIADGQITYAALILFGTHKALGRHLAQAEVVFEWRLRESATKYDRRTEYREGFFLFHNLLWQEIDTRNQVHQYQDGLFRKEIPTFRGDVIREAILNAVSHRDYRKAGSIFVRQWPTRIEIVSPGGFPDGVTSENLLWKQNPRNRRLADAFARCGLVERSGQGADLMYEWNARDAKSLPDYTHSDPYEVWLSLDGQVQDEQFIKFLEKLALETGTTFGAEELFVLSCIRERKIIPERLREIVAKLRNIGAVELSGRKNILSSRYYKMVGRPGEYTRLRGLDRDTNKELILKHIEQSGDIGAPLSELWQVLPHLSRDQVRSFVKKIRKDGKIHSKGATKSSRWFIGPNGGDDR